ncbi:MAG: flavin reductase family protein, partial [Acidimicrobiales bacterium]
MANHGSVIGPVPAGTDPETYDRLRRRVLWRLPMGLYLLGSASGSCANLMTLDWAMQVSVEPKQLAVSVERSAVTHRLIREGGCFALSLLRRSDRAEVRRFAKPAEHDPSGRRLSGVSYTTAVTGAPIAETALAWLDCELRQQIGAGSHTIFVGEVADAG